MKSYDKLKAKIEAIQQQLFKAKKNKLANVPKQVNYLYKELGYTTAMFESCLREIIKFVLNFFMSLAIKNKRYIRITPFKKGKIYSKDNLNLILEKLKRVF